MPSCVQRWSLTQQVLSCILSGYFGRECSLGAKESKAQRVILVFAAGGVNLQSVPLRRAAAERLGKSISALPVDSG